MVICTELRDRAYDELIQLSADSRSSGKEHGIRFCKRGKKIFPIKRCRGTNCNVLLEGNCPNNIGREVDVHTHPGGEPTSDDDIITSVGAYIDTDCVLRMHPTGHTLDCFSNLQTLRKDQADFEKYLDKIPEGKPWLDYYPRFSKFIRRRGVEFCRLKL